MTAYDYEIVDAWNDREFMTGATLVMRENGREIARETFVASSEFENDGPAVTLALSAAVAWLECMEYSLAERLGAFGTEWAREQEVGA